MAGLFSTVMALVENLKNLENRSEQQILL